MFIGPSLLRSGIGPQREFLRFCVMNQIVNLTIGRIAMRAPWLEHVMPLYIDVQDKLQ